MSKWFTAGTVQDSPNSSSLSPCWDPSTPTWWLVSSSNRSLVQSTWRNFFWRCFMENKLKNQDWIIKVGKNGSRQWTDRYWKWLIPFYTCYFCTIYESSLFAFWVELIAESKVDDNVFPIWGKSFITLFCLFVFMFLFTCFYVMLCRLILVDTLY